MAQEADVDTQPSDTASWGKFAGDPDYSIKNDCCLRYNHPSHSFNSGNDLWSELFDTTQTIVTLAYLFKTDKGRALYATYSRNRYCQRVTSHSFPIGNQRKRSRFHREMVKSDGLTHRADERACADISRADVPDLACVL